MKQKNSKEKLTHILLLDAGGFSGGLGQINKIKTDYLLKGFMMMGYSAINLGYRDFLFGSKFIEEMQQKHHVPFVSSNIFNSETGKPFMTQYLIKTIKAPGRMIKMAILGVETKNSSLIPAHRRHGGALLEARDPVETLKPIIAQLKRKADVFICLAHMRVQTAKKMAADLPELDIVILGNDFRNQETMVNDGKTIIVSAGRQGKYIGDLSLTLDQKNRIVAHQHIAAPLNETYKDVAKFTQLLEQFKKAQIKPNQ